MVVLTVLSGYQKDAGLLVHVETNFPSPTIYLPPRSTGLVQISNTYLVFWLNANFRTGVKGNPPPLKILSSPRGNLPPGGGYPRTFPGGGGFRGTPVSESGNLVKIWVHLIYKYNKICDETGFC